MRALALIGAGGALAGCIDPLDPAWSLDHDHVVAVRAETPGLSPGERTRFDALVAHADGPTTIDTPLEVAVPDGPARVYREADEWWVEAPAGLTGAPIAVDVYLAFGTLETPLVARKAVVLGATAANPPPPLATMDGAPMSDSDALSVPRATDVYLSTTVDPAWRVNWLSSCGTLFQDDVATSFLRVQDGDSTAGELAVVVRTPDGGVAWRVWSIHAN